MNCIKEKCKYCDAHDFYYSFYSCHIGGSFKKDSDDVVCVIDYEIEKMEENLREIKQYKQFIKESQKWDTRDIVWNNACVRLQTKHYAENWTELERLLEGLYEN